MCPPPSISFFIHNLLSIQINPRYFFRPDKKKIKRLRFPTQLHNNVTPPILRRLPLRFCYFFPSRLCRRPRRRLAQHQTLNWSWNGEKRSMLWTPRWCFVVQRNERALESYAHIIHVALKAHFEGGGVNYYCNSGNQSSGALIGDKEEMQRTNSVGRSSASHGTPGGGGVIGIIQLLPIASPAVFSSHTLARTHRVFLILC